MTRVSRTELVEEYRGFAISLARRFGNHREPQDDLIQAALVGLLHAIDRFDPERGVEFTTFAFATITGELKRHYRDQTWGVRVPRSLKEQFLAVTKATDELTVELGRSPTIPEIAERASSSEEDVLSALEVSGAYLPVSLDGPVVTTRLAACRPTRRASRRSTSRSVSAPSWPACRGGSAASSRCASSRS